MKPSLQTTRTRVLLAHCTSVPSSRPESVPGLEVLVMILARLLPSLCTEDCAADAT